MQIQNISPIMNFKGATININALSDTHGQINEADKAYQTLMRHRAFEKEQPGKINYLITGGDWFMSGDKKGYKSAPTRPLIEFQLDIYNKFVSEIKKQFPKLKTLFIPGNHEFDGGDELFSKASEKMDSVIIASNIDEANSPLFKKQIDDKHIVKYTVDFVQDDKKPDVSYPVLNLGIAPVNMQFYKKDLKGINFTDNIPHAQKTITPEQYEKTTQELLDIKNKFKEKYPDGIVVLTVHTGVDFAQYCANKGGFDLILNGHEHKKDIEYVNNTPIVNLSMNFNKIVNAKIKIDDDGKKQKILLKDMAQTRLKIKKKSNIGLFYEKLFKQDSKKIYTISCSDDTLKELSTDGVRTGNSHLANFVTDIILSQIKKKDSTVDIFALNASSIRSGFRIKRDKPSITNVDVMNCLAGINTSQANIYITDVTGKELAAMVMDNLLFNAKDKEKNPLIQYAGIKINKTALLSEFNKSKDYSEFCQNIILSETDTAIEPNKTYRIANPIKYFEKTQNKSIRDMLNRSKPLNCNAIELFNDYFNTHPEIKYTPDVRIF